MPERQRVRVYLLCDLAPCNGTATAAGLSTVCFISVCTNNVDYWANVCLFLDARCLSVCVCV